MRNVSAGTLAAINSAYKVGSGRAHARVVIENHEMYNWTMGNPNSGRRELPNVKSISYNRTVDMEVATCSIELFNTENIPMALTGGLVDDFGTERMGWYSPTRGDSSVLPQAQNMWHSWIVPDRTIYTFEGYGIDRTKTPFLDPNMYASGKWLIDDVIVKPDGIIQLECRDVGRELIESVVFPPALGRYPCYYLAKWFYPDQWYAPSTTITQTLIHGWWHSGVYDAAHHPNSANIYTRDGVWDHGNDDNISTPGCPPELAFADAAGISWDDGPIDSTNGYWHTDWRGGTDNFAVVRGVLDGSRVQGVHVITNCREAYVALESGGTWVGDTTIPRASPNTSYYRTIHENISHPVFKVDPKGDTLLPYTVENVTRIKFIGSGWPKTSGRADNNDHSAKIYDIRTTPDMYYEPSYQYNPGYWDTSGMDYTDIVAEMCGAVYAMSGKGHIIACGTGPIEDLGIDIWDQKPLVDAIRYVKDILGYIFWVNQEGYYYFRPPNIYTPGNLVADWTDPLDPFTMVYSRAPFTHTTSCVTLPEASLHQLQVRMSSRNKRDYVFVANVDGNYGSTAAGYDPYGVKMRRVSGWTDQRFASSSECRSMAELIALRQASKFRGASITIPGDPRIEIDDQIIVRERVTGTDYRFYVSGMASKYDAISGVYQYDLDLEWLGTETNWLYNPWTMKLSHVTRDFIDAIIQRDYV